MRTRASRSGAHAGQERGHPLLEVVDLVRGEDVVSHGRDSSGAVTAALTAYPVGVRMPWQQKTLNDELAATTSVQDERPGAKNRPTPKRSVQEAARKQPLVVTDRKVAKERDKEKRREALARQRAAMVTGDDAGLPAA